ncbi:MAG TPA: methyltransferase domain-containing protein [Thermomicrobiales bacterium]|nr:methyltransferase domain-containing protein [Thermomicrobiales bacterium]
MTSNSQPSSDLREWNAESYHKVANPHVDWGKAVLERLPLRGDETVVDAGCGTGRLTELVLSRLPRGRVIAIDQSANMLDQARIHLEPLYPGQATYLQRDLLRLDLDQEADIVFSTATFHWVRDHPTLFTGIYNALNPGGWLIAQCGGGPNIATVANRALALLRQEPFASYSGDWDGPWNFAGDRETVARLGSAGFSHPEAEVIHAPVVLDDAAAYREFLETVVLGTHLKRLPTDDLRQAFLDEMVRQGESDDPPWLLDYWRLNLQGQRPA